MNDMRASARPLSLDLWGALSQPASWSRSGWIVSTPGRHHIHGKKIADRQPPERYERLEPEDDRSLPNTRRKRGKTWIRCNHRVLHLRNEYLQVVRSHNHLCGC